MKILVTSGIGFIGSHTCVELIEAGSEVVIIDNLYNSQADVVNKIENIVGKHVAFYEADCCDEVTLEKIFSEYRIDATIHFAGYKVVGESVQKPIMYYQNNPMSLLALCKVMGEYNCKRIVFLPSATAYGNPASAPISENFPLGSTTNPYDTTKLTTKQTLEDLYVSDNEQDIALLRYFNLIGAHKSGLLGESPSDIPNSLMPYIVKIVNKELPYLHAYGNDYDTPDGAGVCDYIHVIDFAKGYVNAVNKVMEPIGVDAYNPGTGIGYSVLDVVNTFAEANNIEVLHQIDPRRPGDIAQCYTNTEKAPKELDWKAERGLEEMCADAWHSLQTEKEAN